MKKKSPLRKIVGGLAISFALLLFAIAGIFGGLGDSTADAADNGFGGGLSNNAPIPAEVRDLILGSLPKYGCPEVTASLIAAQLHQESNFNAKASSGVADGIAQFTPDTWKTHGVDGNGDGVKDVWNPQDAIPAAIKYDCDLAGIVKDVPGDHTDNMLAAYNAGPQAVKDANGIPPFKETRDYIKIIRALAQQWTDPLSGGGMPLPAGSGGAMEAIAAARQALGTPYVYGGDCRPPFRGGNRGCDCSSLVQYGWSQAGVNLPRTTGEQMYSGTPVADAAHLVPGDLVFTPGSDGTRAKPGHVGMYIGLSQVTGAASNAAPVPAVLVAPHTGAVVHIDTLSSWQGSAGPMNTIVLMRHIG